MNIAQIENNLQQLLNTFKRESFIYDLLLAYGQPNATIKRIKDGGLNLSKIDGEIAWKKKRFFKADKGVDLHELIADLKDKKAFRHDPRFCGGYRHEAKCKKLDEYIKAIKIYKARDS